MRVRGEGPTPCDICYVGEAPGWQEDKAGRPFVGKTGAEIRRLTEVVGLPSFDDCFRTNLYRQYGGKDYVYTREDFERDEPELLEELARVRPKLIVPLGRHATRYLLGDVDMDSVWGLPWQTDRGIIHPIHHPAAGMHNPEMSPYVIAGFQALGQYWRGTGAPVRTLYDDPYPEPVYEEVTTEAELRALLGGNSESALAVDTEGSPKRPWSLQWSHQSGTGHLVRAGTPELLNALGKYLRCVRPRLVYHSALHDLPMMRALGLPTDLEFDDTMVMAYLLQLEPQGLKQGALRLCNMQMQSYQDIMGDADNRLARSYLTWLWERAVFRYEAECEQELVNRLRAGRRCKVIPKLPKPAFLKAVERCLSSPRPRGLWEDQDEAIVSEGVRTLGFVPEASLSHVEPAKAIWYGCRDADATIRYRDQLWPRIEAMGLEDTYRLEMATYPLIDRMAQIGIKPDVDYFTRFGVQLGEEIADLRTELELLTERPGFNANSGDHVAEYLFSTLGLPVGKLTESGRGTTDKKYLKDLEFSYPEYPQIGVIRTYRERYKLKHSFVDVIPTLIKGWPHDGRVHVEFRTTRIPTGRLAASMPRGFPKYNMLAQPKRGKHAKTFRKGWVAEDGHWLGSWDLSQIELRIGAHLSQDPYMLAIYRGEIRNPDGSPIDLHAGLGQRIFGVPKRDQTVEQRTSAKEINFGFWMGQTAKGLKVSLRSNGVMVSEGDAQLWLDEANKTYAGAQPYKDRMIEQARQQGFVRCLSGRIRYIGGITSKDDRIREEAERFAFGTPVQEGAQWLMKQAEARLWADLNYFWKRGRWVEPLLQIHDDLLLELEDDILLARELHTAMVRNLTTIPKGFSVPVETSGDYGRNWAEMTSF